MRLNTTSRLKWLKRWLALSRTRLFVAVLIPAFVGAAIAFASGVFDGGYFLLIVFGLITAELVNLFLGDWAGYRGLDLSRGKSTPPPVIEGSPTIARLPLKYTLHAAIACGIPALAVFIFFVWQVGWPVLAIIGCALVVGAFYVAPPFRNAFFSTAFLPPVIVLGVYFVLSGRIVWWTLLPGLPLSFIAAGIIWTYRIVYDTQNASRFEANQRIVKAFYGLAYLSLLVPVLSGIVTPWALLGLLGLPLVFAIEKAINEVAGYMPATALGVLLHSVTGLLTALGYILAGIV
ncbi:MAG: prenyltransferase [Chloroflexi bacterium]|nr:prenyltransferase [Chloroflexota bacterium]